MSGVSATLVGCLGAACFLTDPYVVGNAVSGMETSIASLAFGVFLFLALKMMSSAERPTDRQALSTGFVAALVAMFRPEMGLCVVVALVAAGAMWPEGRQPLFRSLAVFLLLGAGYYLLRWSYYGLPFPLPFYVKQVPFGLHGLSDLRSYLRHMIFVLPFVSVSLMFVVGRPNGEDRRSCVYVLAVAGAVWTQLVYYSTLRHAMGLGFRYFQPTGIASVVLACVGYAIVCRVGVRSRMRSSVSECLMCCGLIAPFFIDNVRAYRPAHTTFIEGHADGTNNAVQIGKSMKATARGTVFRIAMNDCGAIPFYSGFSVVDLGGLNNRTIALDRRAEATRKELVDKKTQVVILVSRRKHNPGSLVGWERLGQEDMRTLGYRYAGMLSGFGSMQNGDGLYPLVYANAEPVVLAFLDRLALLGVLERPANPGREEEGGGSRGIGSFVP
jgi:arabinofuranosyltransferase